MFWFFLGALISPLVVVAWLESQISTSEQMIVGENYAAYEILHAKTIRLMYFSIYKYVLIMQ